MMALPNILSRSLRARIIVTLVVIVAFVLTLFELYGYRVEQKSAILELEAFAQRKIDRLAGNLSSPLWELDDLWVDQIIDSEMTDENVYALLVCGEEMFHRGKVRDEQWQAVDTPDEVFGGDLISLTRDVVYGPEKIGIVTIHLSKKFMEERLRQKVTYGVVTQLCLSGFLVIFLLFFLNRFILQPLQAVLATAKAVGEGDYSRDITISQNDEIGMLAREVNLMKTKIASREQERREAAEQLQFFRTFVDQAQDAIFIVAADTGRFVEVNEQASVSLGYSREELLAMKVTDIQVALPDAKHFDLLVEKIKKQGGMLIDGEHRRQDGSRVPVEVSAKHVVIGGREYIIASARDVSDKLLARKHVTDLAQIVEDSLNEVYIFDTQTFHFMVANRGGRENLGYTMEELHGLTPMDIKPEHTQESFQALVQPLLSGTQDKLEFNTVHQRKDGSTYPVEIHLQLSSYLGRAVFVAIILDISERKRTEDELRIYQEELESIVQERTTELEKKNQDLERMNRLFVDRELRIKELREQVAKLKARQKLS